MAHTSCGGQDQEGQRFFCHHNVFLFLYSLLPTALNYLIKEGLGSSYNIFNLDRRL